jgi:tetratricopeptide (TPR) repeat protein
MTRENGVEQSDSRSFRTRLLGPALMIAALAVAANLNALAAGFVWDDRALIVGNVLIRRLHHIPNFFREPFLGLYYRPVVMASFALEYALWGLRPLGYHATNVALHAANSVLVYYVLAWAFRARPAALVAALLFASHPAHKGVVAIADRTGILAAFFFLVSLALFVQYRLLADRRAPGRRAACYAGSLLACALALFSKEETIMLPAVVLVLGVRSTHLTIQDALNRIDKTTCVKYVDLTPALALAEYLPFFGIAALYLWARSEVIGHSGGLVSSLMVEPLRRGVTVVSILVDYARLLLFPVHLDYEPRTPLARSLFEPRILLSLLCAAAAAALVLKYGRKARPALFGLLWYLIVFVPMSNIVPIYPEAAHSHFFTPIHFLYLPSIGLLFIWGQVLTLDITARSRFRNGKCLASYVQCQDLTPRLLLCCVLFLFALLSLKRNFIWQDELRLYRYIVRMHPENPRMRLNLGNVYMERGEPEKGLEHLKEAVLLAPDVPAYRNSLALAYKELGWLDLAERELQRALLMEPNSAMAYINLTDLYRAQKRFGDAIKAGRRAVQLAPSSAASHVNLGFAYKDAGSLQEAQGEFQAALMLDADSAEAHNGLGTVYALQGRIDLARREWEQAVRAEPGMQEARHNLERLGK